MGMEGLSDGARRTAQSGRQVEQRRAAAEPERLGQAQHMGGVAGHEIAAAKEPLPDRQPVKLGRGIGIGRRRLAGAGPCHRPLPPPAKKPR